MRRVRNDLEYSVIKGYFDVILAREMVALRENSLQVLSENLKDVDRLFRSGSVSQVRTPPGTGQAEEH